MSYCLNKTRILALNEQLYLREMIVCGALNIHRICRNCFLIVIDLAIYLLMLFIISLLLFALYIAMKVLILGC
jgi:hypothetical protein